MRLPTPKNNEERWAQKNYEDLQNYDNVLTLQPEEGLLACDAIGIGKIPSNDLLQLAIEFIASHQQNKYHSVA